MGRNGLVLQAAVRLVAGHHQRACLGRERIGGLVLPARPGRQHDASASPGSAGVDALWRGAQHRLLALPGLAAAGNPAASGRYRATDPHPTVLSRRGAAVRATGRRHLPGASGRRPMALPQPRTFGHRAGFRLDCRPSRRPAADLPAHPRRQFDDGLFRGADGRRIRRQARPRTDFFRPVPGDDGGCAGLERLAGGRDARPSHRTVQRLPAHLHDDELRPAGLCQPLPVPAQRRR